LPLSSVLTNIAALPELVNLRITVRPCPHNGRHQMFADVTRRNFTTVLQPTLPKVTTLSLFRFVIGSRGEENILPYLMHLFAGVETLHFEDCRIVPGRDRWLLATLKRFTKLRRVLHNNRLVVDLSDRFEATETDQNPSGG